MIKDLVAHLSAGGQPDAAGAFAVSIVPGLIVLVILSGTGTNRR